MEVVKGLYERIERYPFRSFVTEYGMMAGWGAWAEMFQIPREEAEAYFNQEVFSDKVRVATIACPSCPLSDKFLFRIPGEGVEVWATDYLTPLTVFGYLFQIKDYRDILRLTATVNQYGLDMLSLKYCKLHTGNVWGGGRDAGGSGRAEAREEC